MFYNKNKTTFKLKFVIFLWRFLNKQIIPLLILFCFSHKLFVLITSIENQKDKVKFLITTLFLTLKLVRMLRLFTRPTLSDRYLVGDTS